MEEYPERLIYYGHSGKEKDQSDWQTLKNHLEAVASTASIFANEFGASGMAYLAGIHHDIGKYSDAFQNRIRGNKNPVDHSTAGAKECALKYGSVNGRMLAYMISGHHGGMPDWDDGSDKCLRFRLNKEIEEYAHWIDEISVSEEISLKMPDFITTRKDLPFSLVNRTRMLYSCLVDADYLDTEKAFGSTFSEYRDRPYDFEVLNLRLREYMKGFEINEDSNSIDHIRKNVLKECIEKAQSSRGLYSLTVPTGGGKTLSSLAFAINHAIKNKMKRIIYVIPYTSIIEQNANVFVKALGKENVLEHHSSFDFGRSEQNVLEPNEDDLRSRLGTENWSFPVIVTTNIQFLESCFSNKPSKTRKLHNIANSVIILDEAQMLPTELLIPTSALLNDLVNHYKSSVVLCTATQPELNKVFPQLNDVKEISSSPELLKKKLKRVEVRYRKEEIKDHILSEELKSYPQVLCIVNTRKHASKLYDLLETSEGNIFHLSARMIPVHRTLIIEKIKMKLFNNEKCIVISTPVIEAGVDIDFPVVYRAIAGMDSIIQAAGRCNREGRRDKGEVIVFKPEKIGRPVGYLARLASKAESVMRRFEDPLSLEALKEYFRSVYTTAGEELDSKKIMDLHKQAVQKGLCIPFREISRRYKLIENEMVSIVIPFIASSENENTKKIIGKQKVMDSILTELYSSEHPQTYKRQLQQFTVEVYRYEYKTIEKEGAITVIGGFYFLTKPAFYNNKKGILLSSE